MARIDKLTHCCVCGRTLPDTCRTNCQTERCKEGARVMRTRKRKGLDPVLPSCRVCGAQVFSMRDGPVCGDMECRAQREATEESARAVVSADGRTWDAPPALAYLDGPPIYDPDGPRPPQYMVLSKRAAREARLEARIRNLAVALAGWGYPPALQVFHQKCRRPGLRWLHALRIGDALNREEQAEALALAKNLLDDIELDRTTVDKQVLKGARLARLVGDSDAETWLRQERLGFTSDAEQGHYFILTGRSIAMDDRKPFYGSASWIAAITGGLRGQLQASRVPDIASDYALPALSKAHQQINEISNELIRWEGLLSQIGGVLHTFVEKTYHQLRFAQRQEAMFDRAKKAIDDKLRDLDPETLSKIDSASSNLAAGDTEAIAGAMNSVRRLVDSFADAVFPPTGPRPHPSGKGEVLLTAQHKVNRIRAFVDDNCPSKSRRDRLGEGIDKIYGRVSNGVHNDATKEEAEFLFLSTYILLGEILSLKTETS